MILLDPVQVGHVEETFQQQNHLAITRFPQAHRGVQLKHGECVRTRERLGCTQQPVAVGVGLDDRHHARAGCKTPDDEEVVLKRGKIDPRPDWA